MGSQRLGHSWVSTQHSKMKPNNIINGWEIHTNPYNTPGKRVAWLFMWSHVNKYTGAFLCFLYKTSQREQSIIAPIISRWGRGASYSGPGALSIKPATQLTHGSGNHTAGGSSGPVVTWGLGKCRLQWEEGSDLRGDENQMLYYSWQKMVMRYKPVLKCHIYKWAIYMEAGDTGLIPGWKDPLESSGPLQYTCLGNLMDKRSMVHGGHKKESHVNLVIK